MKVETGFVVLITGAGSGIGRALAVEMARRGASINIVDFIEDNGMQTLEMVKKEHAKLKLQEQQPSVIFVKCNVTKPDDVKFAFKKHAIAFNKLDACINCAGIAERGDYLTDKQGKWREIIEVNLNGVIECTFNAIHTMKSKGVILNLASSAGIVSADPFPIYAASKGGVVIFTMSLAGLQQSRGIRVNALCPEFIETPMTKHLPKEIIDATGGFIPMENVVQGALELIEDESKAGQCLWISKRNGPMYWKLPA